MRGYRPSHLEEHEISEAAREAELANDRARRIPNYAERARRGAPLFGDSQPIPVKQEGSTTVVTVTTDRYRPPECQRPRHREPFAAEKT